MLGTLKTLSKWIGMFIPFLKYITDKKAEAWITLSKIDLEWLFWGYLIGMVLYFRLE